DDVNYDIDEELTKDLFIDYCEEYFNDEFVLINNTLYGIIQEVMTYGDIQMYGSLTLYNQEVLLFHTQISMYDMRSNYKSEKRESFYLEMLIEYIGEDKYTMFMENVYNETLNVMFGAGPIDLVFYVSSDYTTIYPWIDMYNDDNASVTTFYKTTLV
ncbi:MAG: hypothetical protein IJA65_05450, partial [Acholeplasmatales bacterium]|nr:hypothetical protein [Acholeplasmatales bacterium]